MAVNRRKIHQIVTCVLLCLGIALLGYSFLWPKGDGGRSQWTAEHAQAKREEALKSHRLALSPELARSPEMRNELLDAREEYEKLEAARQQAIADAAARVRYIRWTGIGLVALGVLAYLQQRKPGQ